MRPPLKRVLCVDDDDDTCSMLSALFDLIGCEVLTAANVQEGLEQAATAKFDLFVLDGWLPGGSGNELCRALRLSYPETPVLFYSAAAYDSDRKEAHDAGADVYLVKPSEIHLLVETARNLLGLPQNLSPPDEFRGRSS